MLGLEQALASPTAYVAVDASGCPGSGQWPRRISLTPAGLEPSRMRLLLIRGEHKRRLFERAMDGTDPLELPIRLAFTTPGARLRVRSEEHTSELQSLMRNYSAAFSLKKQKTPNIT